MWHVLKQCYPIHWLGNWRRQHSREYRSRYFGNEGLPQQVGLHDVAGPTEPRAAFIHVSAAAVVEKTDSTRSRESRDSQFTTGRTHNLGGNVVVLGEVAHRAREGRDTRNAI